MKNWKRILCLGLAVLLLLGGLSPLAFAEEGTADQVTVCLTVEKFTLGKGYTIEPTLIKVPKGTRVSKIVTDRLGQGNYENTGTIDSSFYLAQIKDGDPGTGEIPDCPQYIKAAIAAKGGTLDAQDDGWLGEFDFYNMSGWMISVNNKFINTSASDALVDEGTVMRWQFTVYGYGADLAEPQDWSSAEPLVVAANKDALTWRVAEINAMSDKASVLSYGENQKKYDDALALLKNIESKQTDVDAALANLNHLDEASAVTGDADGDGYVNVSDLRIVKSNFGQSVQTGQNGDVDFDGFVNVSDLRVVKSNFGKQI